MSLKCDHVVSLWPSYPFCWQQLFLALRVYPFLLGHQGWCHFFWSPLLKVVLAAHPPYLTYIFGCEPHVSSSWRMNVSSVRQAWMLPFLAAGAAAGGSERGWSNWRTLRLSCLSASLPLAMRILFWTMAKLRGVIWLSFTSGGACVHNGAAAAAPCGANMQQNAGPVMVCSTETARSSKRQTRGDNGMWRAPIRNSDLSWVAYTW